MKLLLVTPASEVRDSVTLAVESRFNIQVEAVNSTDYALPLLNVTTGVPDYVLTDCRVTAPALLKALPRPESGRAPHCFLFWTEASSESDALLSQVPEVWAGRIEFIPRASFIEAIIAALDARGVPQKAKTGEAKESEFCRIRTPLLVATSPLSRDIYIRLSSQKFVKIFRQGDVFDHQDLERYHIQKNVSYMYLRNEDTGPFITRLTEAMMGLLTPSKTSSLPQHSVKTLATELETNSAAALETLQELSQHLGFTPEVQALAKTTMNQAIAQVKKSPKLSDLLARLEIDKGKYIPVHSTLVGQLACVLASQMDWVSESTYQKLTLASMLHDITMTNHQLAQIKSLADLDVRRAEFTSSEYTTYKEHPIKAAEIVRRFSEIPPDVDTIIMDHHELPGGGGFPRGLNHMRIGPMSALFIVAHDFVDFLFDQPAGTQVSPQLLQTFFTMNQRTYEFGNFKKILRVVPKLGI